MTKKTLRAPFADRIRRAARERARARPELRTPSVARVPATGPVSPPVKAIAPDLRALIDAAIAERTP
jgi:hypothetical protein